MSADDVPTPDSSPQRYCLPERAPLTREEEASLAAQIRSAVDELVAFFRPGAQKMMEVIDPSPYDRQDGRVAVEAGLREGVLAQICRLARLGRAKWPAGRLMVLLRPESLLERS
jgi:hypothetical protein